MAFDGTELARNYVAFFDRIVELRDTKVALLSVGDGGNQCGPATLLVWKPKDGGARSQIVGEDCGSPAGGGDRGQHHLRALSRPGRIRAGGSVDA